MAARASIARVSASSNKPIRWGILGPGRIADKVVPDFVHVPGAQVVAVGSRSQERADAFAERHGIARAHGSYEALLADPEVDAVYISTPHRQHLHVALAAIEAKKALLIEKSFTTTVAGAAQLIDRARAAKVFVMEAMWTRFQPIIVEARARLAAGSIGEVRGLQVDLGVERAFDPKDRLFDLAQGGGAMLDLGVYLVSFAQMILGTPRAIAVQGSLLPTGADAEAALLLDHGDGRRSALLATFRNATPGQARILGSKGYLDILPRFHHPTEMRVAQTGSAPELVRLMPLGAGYSHELIEVTECLRAGKTESTIMPLADTLDVQTIMNEACEKLGVHHTEES